MADRHRHMKRYRYTVHLTRFLLFSMLVCMAGGLFTIKGLVRLYHSHHVKTFYNKEKIHVGDYVRYDISWDQVMGRWYMEASGKDVYGPICSVDAWTSERRYIVASDESKEYYVSLVLSDLLGRQFDQFLENKTEPYSIYGRVERLRSDLYYDGIARCTGINDPHRIEQMVSTKYAIRAKDPDTGEGMWYKGLIFFALGMWGILSGVEKKTLA